jgi:protein dithiol:quinone oxidoreductase
MRTIAGLRLVPRWGYALGFLVCAGLIGFALYLQYFQNEEPCPLCIFQRVAFMALGVVFLVAALHGPARTGATVYGGLLLLVAGIGAAIAARHVWLQHLPRHMVPECGPDLAYMMGKFPLSEVFTKVLAGSGQCAEAGWKFLGLSIAEWALVWFVILGLFSIFLAVLAARSNPAQAGIPFPRGGGR